MLFTLMSRSWDAVLWGGDFIAVGGALRLRQQANVDEVTGDRGLFITIPVSCYLRNDSVFESVAAAGGFCRYQNWFVDKLTDPVSEEPPILPKGGPPTNL